MKSQGMSRLTPKTAQHPRPHISNEFDESPGPQSEEVLHNTSLEQLPEVPHCLHHFHQVVCDLALGQQFRQAIAHELGRMPEHAANEVMANRAATHVLLHSLFGELSERRKSKTCSAKAALDPSVCRAPGIGSGCNPSRTSQSPNCAPEAKRRQRKRCNGLQRRPANENTSAELTRGESGKQPGMKETEAPLKWGQRRREQRA